MAESNPRERIFGLIGYPVSHSFSKRYFTEKFAREGLSDCRYELFPLPSIAAFPELIAGTPSLRGLNVTLPHKETVIPHLDRLDPAAAAVGAVNTIRISPAGCEGFNTDVIGFERSLLRWLDENRARPSAALVLGTGGAAKAVGYVLQKLGVAYRLVSRKPGPDRLTYDQVDSAVLAEHHLIVNTTPLGMAPQTGARPDLPYEQLSPEHLLYDLVYNPEKTLFLSEGEKRKSRTINGLEMLHLQAEAAWKIWNPKL